MCGIVGVLYKEKYIDETDRASLSRALKAITYRGPDGFGIWENKCVLLGHRRLSIIDLSEAGTQPLVDKERGLVITFNGEIYNYREIRKSLSAKGYRFRTHTDTEVILYCYDYYGDDFLSLLHGMFAFCLYDQKKNTALLVRDRIGKKPLYYYRDEEQIIFTSEIKLFHAFNNVPLNIDLKSLEAYFTLQYIPGINSIYEDIKKVAPGEFLKINLWNWHVQHHQYWSLLDQIAQPKRYVSLEEVDRAISQSVRYRLVADVEVGVLLSGGVDSSLLSSYASEQGRPIRAFTAKFDHEVLDELPYASQVARILGLDLISIEGDYITPDIFYDVVFHADEPLGDAACVPTYMLAKTLSNHVKVVLSGEGADELFWGYDFYRYEILWQYIKWIRALFSKLPLQTIVSNLEITPNVPSWLIRLAKVFSTQYELGAARWTTVFADGFIGRLLGDSISNGCRSYLQEMNLVFQKFASASNPYIGSLSLDMAFWLPDDLLVKVDRMTMAHSVEARAPFLDHKLIELVTSISPQYKANLFKTKNILRQLLARKLPPSMGHNIAYRKKHGFETPIAEWMTNQLRSVCEDRLSPSALASSGILNAAYVHRLWEAFLCSRTTSPLRRKLWLLICFQTWYFWHERKFDL